LGGIVMPPVPAFYHRPTSLEEVIDHTLNRALDLLNIELKQDLFARWKGPPGHSDQGKVSLMDRPTPSLVKT
jgi:flavin prenyltransferase